MITTITLDDLHEYILEADSFDLHILEAAIEFRREALHLPKKNAVEDATVFKTGDTVVFTNTIKPMYLRGKTATFEKYLQSNVKIRCPKDTSYRRFSGKLVNASPKLIRKA